MSDIDTEKMELFEQEIMRRAASERDVILAETERMKQEELEKEKDHLLAEQYRKIQAEIDRITTENIREISRETLALKKQRYVQREQYLSHLIAKARAELSAFAGGEGYEAYLFGKIGQLARDYRMDGSVIRVRAQDLHYAERIKELYGDCVVEADDTMAVGGAVLVNLARGIEVDLSLDTALAAQREWFYQSSNFKFE